MQPCQVCTNGHMLLTAQTKARTERKTTYPPAHEHTRPSYQTLICHEGRELKTKCAAKCSCELLALADHINMPHKTDHVLKKTCQILLVDTYAAFRLEHCTSAACDHKLANCPGLHLNRDCMSVGKCLLRFRWMCVKHTIRESIRLGRKQEWEGNWRKRETSKDKSFPYKRAIGAPDQTSSSVNSLLRSCQQEGPLQHVALSIKVLSKYWGGTGAMILTSPPSSIHWITI